MNLKPHQKVELINKFLLPSYIYRLIVNLPSMGTLGKIDHKIKQVIKSILHLHSLTTDGLIYTDRSHGDLGIMKLVNVIKLTKIRSIIKMEKFDDEAAKELKDIGRKCANSIGLRWRTSLKTSRRSA